MDPPTWARYVLDDVPAVEPLLSELGRHVSAGTLARLRSTVFGGPEAR
jgi:hypothetical protein